MTNFVNTIARFLRGLQRPSKATNIRLLRERGETQRSFVIREARSDDIAELARLHVKTWNETYRNVKNPPTVQIRENQWREQFKVTDGSWFCFVVEDPQGELVGFAKGNAFNHSDLPDFSGELSKIYLLSHYQRIGLGRRLVCQAVHRFLSEGVSAMVLFSVPENPSCRFFEALGGKRLLGKNGGFHGSYGWHDLEHLAATCCAEQVSRN